MATALPARFKAATSGDAARVAIAAVIEKLDEVSDHVERPNFLYAVAGRRVLTDRVFQAALTTTSASFLALPDWFARLSETRDEVEVITFAEDAVIQVSLFNASSGGGMGTPATLTHPSGSGSTQAATISIPAPSLVEEILVRVEFKRNVTSASFYSVRVLEESLTSPDIPT